MDVWFYTERKGKEVGEQLELEPVSLVINKGRLRWFGHVEHKHDADWVKHCDDRDLDCPRKMVGLCQAGYVKLKRFPRMQNSGTSEGKSGWH